MDQSTTGYRNMWYFIIGTSNMCWGKCWEYIVAIRTTTITSITGCDDWRAWGSIYRTSICSLLISCILTEIPSSSPSLFCRAQLTQAVLLPPHAHVLELLPWIPDYIRGKWVQTKHMPTPLGVIFLNTDLKWVIDSLDDLCVDMLHAHPINLLINLLPFS